MVGCADIRESGVLQQSWRRASRRPRPAHAAARPRMIAAGGGRRHSRGMIALCRLAVTTALALGLLAGCEEEPQPAQGRENLPEVKPPAGPQYTGEICPVVRNREPFTITGRILLPSRERVTLQTGAPRAGQTGCGTVKRRMY